jgi:hypothetical protein
MTVDNSYLRHPLCSEFLLLIKAAPPGPLARCSIRGQALACGLAPGPRQSPAEQAGQITGEPPTKEGVLAGRAGLRDRRIGATLRYVRGLSASRQTSTRTITPRQGGSPEFGRRLGGRCPLDTARSGFRQVRRDAEEAPHSEGARSKQYHVTLYSSQRTCRADLEHPHGGPTPECDEVARSLARWSSESQPTQRH